MARPRSDISGRIARAARERFLLEGVDGASLRAIASDAETSIGMVYYYFPTKDDLFVEVVETVYAKLLEDLALLMNDPAPIAEKLQRLYSRIWQTSDDEYAIIRLVMREAMVSADRVRRLSPIFAQGHVPILLGALLSAVGGGELRDDLPPVAFLVVTIALGMMPMIGWRVAGQRLMPDFPLPNPEELGALFSSILLNGIGAAGRNAAQPLAKPKRRKTK